MSTSGNERRAPIAAYTDIDDTDVSLGVQLLEAAGFETRIIGSRDPDDIAAGAADADALLVGYAAVDAALIARLPRLRHISVMSMGTDNIDVEAAAQRGITVGNVPGAATEEVATHTLALILSLVRQLGAYQQIATPTRWNERAPHAPSRLSEQTLGIVGLGRIGRKVAALARPFFGEIVGYDPMLPDDASMTAQLTAQGIRRASLAEVRAASDVLSLHLPLTEETHHMIDEAFLAGMPDGSLLINVSRGALLHTEAVIAALDSGRLRGVGLDVLETEPPAAGHPFLGRDDVIVTPHIAYYSSSTERDYVRIHAQNAVDWLLATEPDDLMTPHTLATGDRTDA